MQGRVHACANTHTHTHTLSPILAHILFLICTCWQAVDPEELLREAEEAAGIKGPAEPELLDARGLRRLVLNLERKVGVVHGVCGMIGGNVGRGFDRVQCRCLLTQYPSPPNTHMVQYNLNMEMRAKYGDSPEKFLESEIELDEAVKGMMVRLWRGRMDGEGCHAVGAADWMG
jgi:hypothetical protein